MQQERNQLVVKVKLLTGQVYEFVISRNTTVNEFVKIIQEKINIPVNKQRLVYMGKKINQSDQKISNIVNNISGQTIHLIAKMETQQGLNQNRDNQNPPPPSNTNNTTTIGGQIGNTNVIIRTVTNQQGMVSNIQNIMDSLINPLLNSNLLSGNLQANRSQQSGQSQQQSTTAPYIVQQVNRVRQQNRTRRINELRRTNNNNQRIQVLRSLTLPHQNLNNLNIITQNMIRNSNQYPIPQNYNIVNGNSLQRIGLYLSNYNNMLHRIQPFVQQVSDLLQRQPNITQVNQRKYFLFNSATVSFANQLGKALIQVVKATEPLSTLLRDMQIGQNVGQFRLFDRRTPEPSNQIQTTQTTTNISQREQTQPVCHSIEIESVIETQNIGQNFNLPQENKQNNQQHEREIKKQQTKKEEIKTVIIQKPEIQNKQKIQNQSTQNNFTQNIIQQNKNPQNINMTNPFNFNFNAFLPQNLSEEQKNSSNQYFKSVQNQLHQNMGSIEKLIIEQLKQDYQNPIVILMDSLKPITFFHLIQITKGNFSIFDNKSKQLKQMINRLIQLNGSRQNSINHFARQIAKLVNCNNINDHTYQGFQPLTVSIPIFQQKLQKIFSYIELNQNHQNFSSDLTQLLKNMFAQVFYQVSDGLKQGKSGLIKIITQNFPEQNSELNSIIKTMGIPLITNIVNKLYNHWVQQLKVILYDQNKQKSNQQQQFIKRISQQAPKDISQIKALNIKEISNEYKGK